MPSRRMPRLLFLACILVLATSAWAGSARADDVANARRRAEAARLLHAREAGWVGEIAGYNRRNALCDRTGAMIAYGDQVSLHPLFVRELGWRWDAGASRWIPAPVGAAEVRLQYAGPVQSGTVTLEGHETSFCNAEAPNQVSTSWRQGDADGAGWSGDSLSLAALPPGFGAPATDAVEAVGPATPLTERAARIAKATALLRDEAMRLAKRGDVGDEPPECLATAGSANGHRHKDWIDYLRHDTALDTWVTASPDEADVVLDLSTPWDGKAAVDRQCLPFRHAILTARATWQGEGTTVVIFQTKLN